MLTLAVRAGTVYAGGGFTQIGGRSRSFLAAIDSVSGVATDWSPDPSDYVSSMSVAGSKIYVAGGFRTIGGQSRNLLAAIDIISGAADRWDPAPADFVNAVVAMDDAVFAGGGLSFGSIARQRLAAFDVRTGRPTSWNPGVEGSVYEIVGRGSTIYVGGQFFVVGGQPRKNLAELDAFTGAATAWAPEPDNTVFALAVSNGVVYAGGHFTSIGGQLRNKLAALDAATALATSWDPDVGGPSPVVSTIALQGSTIFVGGWFASIGGQLRNNLAELDAQTGLPTSFSAHTDSDVGHVVASDNSIYVTGGFTLIDGERRSGIAKLDAGTGQVLSWDPGPSSDASTRLFGVAVRDTTVYVTGNFRAIGGVPRDGLAAIDASTGLALGWDPELRSQVLTCVTLGGGAVYVGGGFSTVALSPHANLAGFDVGSGGRGGPGGEPSIPSTLRLQPNPFQNTVTMRFTLQRAGVVQARVLDPGGRVIRRIEVGARTSGESEFIWDGNDSRGLSVPAGLYLVQLDVAGQTLRGKLFRVK